VLESGGDYAGAEELFKRALGIWEDSFDDDHPAVVNALVNLVAFYRARRMFEEAEQYENRAKAILMGNE
jgi:tetratricopeptide (TPR) repeat protein